MVDTEHMLGWRRKCTYKNIYHMVIRDDYNRDAQICEQDVYIVHLFVHASETLKRCSSQLHIIQPSTLCAVQT
jgi:hypothetical protein